MNVTMTHDGILKISPDTGAEAFALRAWAARNYVGLKPNEVGSPYWLSSGLSVSYGDPSEKALSGNQGARE